MKRNRTLSALAFTVTTCGLISFAAPLSAQQDSKTDEAWKNRTLSADQRADLLLHMLTLDQKIQLLHGTGDPHDGPPDPLAKDANGGSGYVPGFENKGFPGLQSVDSASGVAYAAGSGRYATALPSNIAAASSWDTSLAERYGAMIGQELRDLGYNMTLGGGVNLTREPRDGRTFEYQGEDPILSGTMVGHLIRGVQSTHVVGHIKHFAVNDQESGRHAVSSEISERAMRETDLLAFKIGLEIGQPGAVMCAYNRVNGDYACENDFLLHKVLKGEWKYPGFVISDWLATHSTVKASHAGLDQEQPGNVFFGSALKKAVQDGAVSQAELDDHAHRVLRSMFAAGVVDDIPTKRVPDVFAHATFAREVEQKSIVLLRNEQALLPLNPTRAQHILVVGRNADKGIPSGGGSAQVDAPGGNVIGTIPEKDRKQAWQKAVWFPGAPLAALRESAPAADVRFEDGTDAVRTAKAAAEADVVLVFAYQLQAEGEDLTTLGLPDGQDALIDTVAKANPHTVVILQTGGPVLMPWVKSVSAVMEAWYPGTSGAGAMADVLFGKVNPSAKLPVTFPLREEDLPHPQLVLPPPASQEDWSNEAAMSRKLLAGLPTFPTRYDEGLQVGYRWYDQQQKPVLFPFGFGLSYTTFSYSGLRVQGDADTTVTFRLKNSGSRSGDEIAQVYLALPTSANEPPKRLVGWKKVHLEPGEEQEESISIPRERFGIWDGEKNGWIVPAGAYRVMLGTSSASLPLQQTLKKTRTNL
ncbi:beta-glucosidase-like glycosyl hydrolase [Terriglobus roseus DSM 18391]|uniref:Beta-glucosidase-like glycosyl hydrolase n=1 Tax=Terriglobus roseus (strain DSM 18391 / NRRL B-41598 / KBS 63) TaxID=926566 RepID=I3ZJ55_TERRK|nr:glycoside hydrolase family 3 C-terminal domain-containing protein [Terriglobus roseus]AFL89273.1 beta-glucosidase-like glycosyl hydrolase [Terriglobus roseus DSM 18391]